MGGGREGRTSVLVGPNRKIFSSFLASPYHIYLRNSVYKMRNKTRLIFTTIYFEEKNMHV